MQIMSPQEILKEHKYQDEQIRFLQESIRTCKKETAKLRSERQARMAKEILETMKPEITEFNGVSCYYYDLDRVFA